MCIWHSGDTCRFQEGEGQGHVQEERGCSRGAVYVMTIKFCLGVDVQDLLNLPGLSMPVVFFKALGTSYDNR